MLNENLTWAQVGAIATGPGTTVSDAFRTDFGPPSRERLERGMSLYKFNGYDALGQGPVTAATPLSPWWSPTEAFKEDGGLQGRIALAKEFKVSMRELGRLTSAINENWNSLEWLLEITLGEPVYAWFGGFKGMPRIDAGQNSRRDAAVEQSGGTNLPGGGRQFYIPNLTVGHIIRSPHFTRVDDLGG